MGSEIFMKTLGDVCYITDGAHAKVERQVSGVMYLTSKNIGDGQLKLDSFDFISDDCFSKLFTNTKRAQRRLQTGDVLMGIIGTFGNCYVYKDTDHFGISSSVAILRPDQSKLLPEYLYYYISSASFKAIVEKFKGGSVQGYTNIATLKALPIPLPSIAIQKAIVENLIPLDNKITLNRQINQTLEQMAQTLFKSWFVDFDPVIDNALDAGNAIPDELQARAEQRQAQRNAVDEANKENAENQPHSTRTNPATGDTLAPSYKPLPDDIRQLFPNEFEESELGWVPKGWANSCFGDLLESTIGGDWGKDVEDDKHTTQSRIIRGTDIPDLISGQLSQAPLRWVEPKKLKTRKIEIGDIIIEVSGGSPKQPTGRSLFITQAILERLGGVVEPASFCRRFKPKSFNLGMLASLHLQKIYADGKMWEYQNQSTGIANFQTKFFLEAENVLVPTDGVLNAFCNIVMPMIEKSQDNEQIMLSDLRDTLLPKLISGELRLDEVESTIAETTTA